MDHFIRGKILYNFTIFENKFFNSWKYLKKIFQNKIFINKLLNLIIIDLFLKIEDRQIVENLFSEWVIHDFSKSHHFQKFGKKQCEKNHLKIKFVKYIIFLCFKLFNIKKIFSLLNFNKNIAILESKII